MFLKTHSVNHVIVITQNFRMNAMERRHIILLIQLIIEIQIQEEKVAINRVMLVVYFI